MKENYKKVPLGNAKWIVKNGKAHTDTCFYVTIHATSLKDGVYKDKDVYIGMGLAGPALFKLPINE